jgi:hypothetical protein
VTRLWSSPLVFLEELRKCEPLCSACHHRHHKGALSNEPANDTGAHQYEPDAEPF